MTIHVEESGGIVTVTCGGESVEVAGHVVNPKPASASSDDDDPGLGKTSGPSVFSIYLSVPDMKGLPNMAKTFQPAMDRIITSASFKTLLRSTKHSPFVFVVKPGEMEGAIDRDFLISSQVNIE